jgi:hypothetical protein
VEFLDLGPIDSELAEDVALECDYSAVSAHEMADELFAIGQDQSVRASLGSSGLRVQKPAK